MLSAFFKGKFNSVFLPRSGMVAWVTHGLTKVLPQPDEKYKETVDEIGEHTEVSHKVTLFVYLANELKYSVIHNKLYNTETAC